jgi:hypothetical protein
MQVVSTLVGQANADGAIAVGAARYNKVAPYVSCAAVRRFFINWWNTNK